MRFMASITFDLARRSDLERTLPAEQARIRELQQQGALEALYIPDSAGVPANVWAVFNADSQDAVQQALESLPMYPYMQIELTQLRSLETRA
jgi:muconolactone delta-isomerase